MVVELKISEYFRRLRILRRYASRAMNEDPVSLEEACGRRHVGRNELIVHTNGINLDGQHDRDAGRLQLPRKLYDGCASETLPVKNQAGGFSFARDDLSV